MKKTTLITAVLFTLALVFSADTSAQKFSKLDASPMDAASFPSDYKEANKAIKITYGRPQLKGRDMNALAPSGKVWRTGANEAAEITLYKDMHLGGKLVKAGTYTFYVIPGDSEWTAIINTDLNVWGSYFYDEGKDVARASASVESASDSVEAFSIAFMEGEDDGVDMYLAWGTTRVKVPFTK